MKNEKILIGIGILVIVTVFFLSGCIEEKQNQPRNAGEYIPGTMCEVHTDCKFIKRTNDNDNESGLCAVPDDYAKFFNVPVNVDTSKECYCMASYDMGPINVCAPKQKQSNMPTLTPYQDKMSPTKIAITTLVLIGIVAGIIIVFNRKKLKR